MVVRGARGRGRRNEFSCLGDIRRCDCINARGLNMIGSVLCGVWSVCCCLLGGWFLHSSKFEVAAVEFITCRGFTYSIR